GGAGDGAPARRLRDAGWEVTAIDPRSETPDVSPVALADLPSPDAPYDAAVAVVSLHHVEPLEESVERLAEVMAPGARLLLDEFDASMLDERASAWWLAQRHARGGDDPETPEELGRKTRGKAHPIDALTRVPAPWFDVGEPVRGLYLYRWHLDESVHPEEQRLVDEQELPRTGVRIIARRRAR